MARFTLPRDLYHGKGSLEVLKQLKGLASLWWPISSTTAPCSPAGAMAAINNNPQSMQISVLMVRGKCR